MKAITLLLQCILQIAVNFTQLPASRDIPAKILQSLLNLSTSPDPSNGQKMVFPYLESDKNFSATDFPSIVKSSK